ncbi:hypothetical protein ODZ84_09750 [Chryseobacterium fluminis]|uniref:hypothetical protein n=1 Tax=Chryseobacterium fluminis TaxID=2983606 RepID=UPI002254D358|nr:hypothetical protein [Chryseobacterium sp. MMS21-Ot14]UZT99821.1 hypothetical protein ODZ84_09750 [Chryseobacterium sp. MMS21-Ot14]
MNGDGKNPFSHIDFTKFGAENINEEANLFQNWLANLDEEPTNFFGKGDLPNFHNKFDEMYSRFKNTKGDGIFRAFGHGDFGGIWMATIHLSERQKILISR